MVAVARSVSAQPRATASPRRRALVAAEARYLEVRMQMFAAGAEEQLPAALGRTRDRRTALRVPLDAPAELTTAVETLTARSQPHPRTHGQDDQTSDSNRATHDKIIVVGMWSRKPRHEPAQAGTEQPDAPQKPLRPLEYAASHGSSRHPATHVLGGF